MEKQIYFLKKAFIQTKDWDSFLFFLSYVKDLNADDKLALFKNIIENISINSINDNENLMCKLTNFFGNIFYENQTYYKIFRDEIFKQFSETSNQKIDNLFSIYLSKVSNGVLEEILLKDKIVYKLINKKLTNSLNIFINKDLYIFLNENNINAINDSLWLEYIKNTGNTFLEAKSDVIVYKKAWQKLYMNGDELIKNIILQNIKNEEVKILETDHYFLKIENEIKESNFTKNIEDISKETNFEVLKKQ